MHSSWLVVLTRSKTRDAGDGIPGSRGSGVLFSVAPPTLTARLVGIPTWSGHIVGATTKDMQGVRHS